MNYFKLIIGIIVSVIAVLLVLWGIIATSVAVNLNNENVKIKTEKNMLLMDNEKYRDEASIKDRIIKQYDEVRKKLKESKSIKDKIKIIDEMECE